MSKVKPVNKRVLVVAAHPDDEVLGCGGTIARHINESDSVHVVILAEGITSRSQTNAEEAKQKELSKLAQAAQQANEILGVTSLTLHNFPDNRMDSVDRLDVIKMVEGVVEKIQPEIVYTHHAGDINIDHRRIHEAVITACRPQPGHCVKTLLFFEVASSTECQPPGAAPPFHANWFVDISSTFNKKLEALVAYASEMRDWPHARSVKALEHLARWRGSCVGVEAAEAFILGRRVVYKDSELTYS